MGQEAPPGAPGLLAGWLADQATCRGLGCNDVMPILESSWASRTFLVLGGFLSCLLASLVRLAPHAIAALSAQIGNRSLSFPSPSLPRFEFAALDQAYGGLWSLGPWRLPTCACFLSSCPSPRPGNLEHGPRKHTITYVAGQVLCTKWRCLEVSGVPGYMEAA